MLVSSVFLCIVYCCVFFVWHCCLCACVCCNNYVDACVCVLFVVHRMMSYGVFLCDVCLCVCVNCVCVMCL